jgi:Ni2+-binding GTPase involved in maturation of urease and hydrogenase
MTPQQIETAAFEGVKHREFPHVEVVAVEDGGRNLYCVVSVDEDRDILHEIRLCSEQAKQEARLLENIAEQKRYTNREH